MCQHAMRSCGRGAEGMAGAFRKVNSVLQATNMRVYKEQELGINRRKVLLLENSRGVRLINQFRNLSRSARLHTIV